VLYWHAGERLYEYIQQGQIADLSELYQQEKLTETFEPAVISSISWQNKIYALPTSYYQIGFYYNIPVFERLGLVKPTTWDEFLGVCAQLKTNDIPPIFIGTKSNWSATAWFDYLNLRINGLSYHQQLLAGKQSFLEPQVRQVLTQLQTIVQADYFIADHQQYDWKQGIAPLFRGRIGMVMFGNYAVQDFPQAQSVKIGYFKFPIFASQDFYYEEAPLDILLIPSKNKDQQLAEIFLNFAAQSDNQQRFNQTLGIISPNKYAQINNSILVQQASDVLSNAADITQFFDRDAHSEFAEKVMPVIDAFLIEPDINKTLLALEKIRLELCK
jgi:multiple sugar transport system substrate-binding protein